MSGLDRKCHYREGAILFSRPRCCRRANSLDLDIDRLRDAPPFLNFRADVRAELLRRGGRRVEVLFDKFVAHVPLRQCFLQRFL